MKAVRYYEPEKPLKSENIEIPKPNEDEVLIKVKAAGLCHTDLHFLDGTLKPWKGTLPLTLGHEIAGDISEVGTKVKEYKKGERVVVSNVISCGKCYYCKTGHENLCSNLDQIGFTVDGGYAEYVKAPESTLIELPNNVSYESGSVLTCAAASCYHALVGIAQASPGETLLLNGFGGLGSNALQIAKSLGLQVIAVDVSEEKLKSAIDLGALATINATSQKVDEEAKKITKGEGVDIALELVGRTKTIENAFRSLRKRGRLVFIGYTKDTFTLNPLELVVFEGAIKGSVAYTKSDLRNVVRLASEGKISPIISESYRLDEVNEALEKIRAGQVLGRAVVNPNKNDKS
jgi:alcohol dehydrogenase, propanol-preferring